MKRTGNEVMRLIGGREIHPVNVRVGGFYRAPTRRELRTLIEPLERAREQALETVRWTAGFDFPQREVECDLVALVRAGDYAIERGRIGSSGGLDIRAGEYDEHFVEEHVERSNALHSRLQDGGTYLCGPLARFTLNGDRLSPLALEAAREAGVEPPCRDAFRSIVVRSVELVYACDEALRLIEAYEEPDAPAVEVEPVAGTGYGVTRRREGSSTTATGSTPTGRSSTRRSCRRRRRTSWRSRTISAASSGAMRTSPTRSCACSASRRSVTTTRASRAPRTS